MNVVASFWTAGALWGEQQVSQGRQVNLSRLNLGNSSTRNCQLLSFVSIGALCIKRSIFLGRE